jgi:hypothetical protein
MTTTAVQVLCQEPGCTLEVRAAGYCNRHYLAQWRERVIDLEREMRKAFAKHGDPASYYCDGDESCETSPNRWWVRGGDLNEPLALCPKHAEQIIERLKQDIRRLELKT